MVRISILMAFTALLGAAGGIQAAEPLVAKPVYGPLTASQNSQIQMVGRGVLAAKGVEQATSEELALLQSLHGVAAIIDELLLPLPPTLNARIDTGNAVPSTLADRHEPSLRGAAITRQIGSQLDRLKNQRRSIETLPLRDDTTNSKIAHVQHLSRQTAGIQQSLEDALAVEDDTERFARLSELKQRLRSRTLAEWWADRKDEAIHQTGNSLPDADTPTLSTRIQHRSGLDDLKAGKR